MTPPRARASAHSWKSARLTGANTIDASRKSGADRPRCGWAKSALEIRYHDREWGIPVRRDRTLFEALILEGAQAGLSWATILHKRPHYRAVFARFEPRAVARFTPARVVRLLADPGIVRNRLKVAGAVTNAKRFLEVQREFGSFAAYLRCFAGLGADALSRDLKKRGFTFVGATIVYSFMQAVGMVDDHEPGCWRAKAPQKKARRGRPIKAGPTSDRKSDR